LYIASGLGWGVVRLWIIVGIVRRRVSSWEALVGSVYGWAGGKLEGFCVLEERPEWAVGGVLYLVLELFKVGEGAD